MSRSIIGLVLACIFFNACDFESMTVDTIIHNAVVYTVDAEFNIHEAIAIDNGLIVETGTEHYILNKYKGKNKIDAVKKVIYPGFIDAHCHFLKYGLDLQELDLRGVKSEEEMVSKVVRHSKTNPSDWILGNGWDHNTWDSKELPSKEMLDELFPNTPVYLKRIDIHVALANQKALDLAGITEETFVDGGEVVLYNGKPTGVLIDRAMDRVDDIIPPKSKSDRINALLRAQEDCFKVGLTTVSDAALDAHEVKMIQELQESGELKMRIYAMLMDKEMNYTAFLEEGPLFEDRLTVCAFKFFMDGALGSGGASLLEPYSDDSGNVGLLMYTADEFESSLNQLKENGWQACTHCIGDSANRMVIKSYGKLLERDNSLRWRIEHAQMVTPNDQKYFRDYSIIPSVQPTHATSDMSWIEDKIGLERMKYAYSYKDLLDYAGIISLGTDFPVEKINPILTFYSAVFRRPDMNFDWQYEIRNGLSREEALKGMTIWAAYSNFEETKKGSLEPGKYADLIILDRDLLKVKEHHILDTQVKMTFCAGELVYESKY